MKIRDGFVSNSSSSSFLIKENLLTEKQISQIYNYYVSAIDLQMKGIPQLTKDDIKLIESTNIIELYKSRPDLSNDAWCYMNWSITTQIINSEKYITGFTVIDNFSMSDFFNLIGVDNNIVEWK